MIDFKATPIVLATTLYHHSVEKVDTNKALSMIDNYFKLFHEEISAIDIGSELTLTASIAEVYTTDPIYTLFLCGITIFPEIFCIDTRKLKTFLHTSSHRLLENLKANGFMEFQNIPFSFKQTLFRLGYTDSTNWNIFYIPQINDFSLHVLRHKAIVQAFPAELMSTLTESLNTLRQLLAKREKVIASVIKQNQEKPRISKIMTRRAGKKIEAKPEEEDTISDYSDEENEEEKQDISDDEEEKKDTYMFL